jgi:hypothetical protein
VENFRNSGCCGANRARVQGTSTPGDTSSTEVGPRKQLSPDAARPETPPASLRIRPLDWPEGSPQFAAGAAKFVAATGLRGRRYSRRRPRGEARSPRQSALGASLHSGLTEYLPPRNPRAVSAMVRRPARQGPQHGGPQQLPREGPVMASITRKPLPTYVSLEEAARITDQLVKTIRRRVSD